MLCGFAWGVLNNLMKSLPYFKDDAIRKHIFLSSTDHAKSLMTFGSSRNLPIWDNVYREAFVLTYGPKSTFSDPGVTSREIIIPANDAGFGYPFKSIKRPKHFMFLMVGPVRLHLNYVTRTRVYL